MRSDAQKYRLWELLGDESVEMDSDFMLFFTFLFLYFHLSAISIALRSLGRTLFWLVAWLLRSLSNVKDHTI